MSSLKKHEGYLVIDNRAGPGNARPANGDTPYAGEGQVYESATITCSHCHAIVILNPKRTRPRHYCRGCNRYICDRCSQVRARTLECSTLNQRLDEAQERAALAEQAGTGILLSK